jgi:hypothetical protein
MSDQDGDLLQENLELGESYFNYDLLMKDIPKLHIEPHVGKDNTLYGDLFLYNPPFLILFEMPE